MFRSQQASFAGFIPTEQDLENWVEYWHTHDTGSSLGEFLGISMEEYELWLTRGDDALLDALRRRRPVSLGKSSSRLASSLR